MWRLANMEKRFSGLIRPKLNFVTFVETQCLFIILRTPSYSEAWWRQHRVVDRLFISKAWETGQN